MSITFSNNGNRIEVLRMPNGGIDIYNHGMVWPKDGHSHRCTDLDNSLFHLGPEETKKLLDFLKEQSETARSA